MQTVRPPYGNVFFPETNALDKLSDRLYQEEKLKEQRRYQEGKMLDDEFARNLSGIRDSDIGDLTKAYGDYKMAYTNSMRKRGGLSPQEQMEILRKKASVYDIINKSKEQKAWEDAQSKQIASDRKGFYADDANQQLLNRRRTPLSRLNFDNDRNLLYQYSVPDFDKYNKMALGTPMERRGATRENGLNDETPVYKVGNNPNQMYDVMLNNIVKDNKGKNAIGLINHSFGSEEEKQDLMDRYYQKIKDPKFIAAYGEVQPFPQSSQTELGNAVMLQTMKNVVDAPIPEPKIEVKVNPDRKRKAGMEDWLKKNGITYAQALNKIRLNASLQGKGGESVTVSDVIMPDGNTDLTKLLQGINVNNLVTGKSFKSDKTIYNPKTKEITFHDIVDDKDYTVPASKFRQIINTINTVQDLKTFDNLIEGIDKAYAPPKASGTKNRPPLNAFIKNK